MCVTWAKLQKNHEKTDVKINPLKCAALNHLLDLFSEFAAGFDSAKQK